MANNGRIHKEPKEGARYAALYKHPMPSTRGGALYNAFPYATKISPEVIAVFIAAHTNPGDTVFDGFAGSGSTGIAAILCGNPTTEMKNLANRMRLSVRWGHRRAVLYELSTLGAFIGRVLCSPPDPKDFEDAANELLATGMRDLDWVYGATDPDGKQGTIRHVVWSDVLRCPECRKQTTLWDSSVARDPARISDSFACGHCGASVPLKEVTRVRRSRHDELIGDTVRGRKRSPAWVYGSTNGKTWSRPATRSDTLLLRRIDSTSLPSSVPVIPVPWGDLYRSGYHEGISHLHHFYTRRNLLVFSTLWSHTTHFPPDLCAALRFWLLSYNASHSTLMTRVVAKRNQPDLVVTSAQSGVLYISGLPVEKNIFRGLMRKLRPIREAFSLTASGRDLVTVRNQSSLSVDEADQSIDYAFTDPPFGGYIPYSEVNFINEAWLGCLTDKTEEAIVSPSQGKHTEQYHQLLTRAFKEVSRILRPRSCATVVFHASSAEVWKALQTACAKAGLRVDRTNILDKTQGSFKQVTATATTKGDPLILLRKHSRLQSQDDVSLWALTEQLVDVARRSNNPAELSPQRIYSRVVGHYLSQNHSIPIDAREFYEELEERHELCGAPTK